MPARLAAVVLLVLVGLGGIVSCAGSNAKVTQTGAGDKRSDIDQRFLGIDAQLKAIAALLNDQSSTQVAASGDVGLDRRIAALQSDVGEIQDAFKVVVEANASLEAKLKAVVEANVDLKAQVAGLLTNNDNNQSGWINITNYGGEAMSGILAPAALVLWLKNRGKRATIRNFHSVVEKHSKNGNAQAASEIKRDIAKFEAGMFGNVPRA